MCFAIAEIYYTPIIFRIIGASSQVYTQVTIDQRNNNALFFTLEAAFRNVVRTWKGYDKRNASYTILGKTMLRLTIFSRVTGEYQAMYKNTAFCVTLSNINALNSFLLSYCFVLKFVASTMSKSYFIWVFHKWHVWRSCKCACQV